jgi:predicted ArsR family transcriptional regulator
VSEDVVTSHRALAHASRVRLLELVRDADDGADVASLAASTDLHPNTVRSHLDQLVAAGLVRGVPARRGRRGRPSIRYHAAPSDDERGYRLLASVLASALHEREREGFDPDAEAAGRRFGRRLVGDRPRTSEASDGEVRELFDDLGFDPEREGERIVLRACPYRELARRHPDVVCGAHLGLLRGVVDAYGGHGDDAWLEPFVTPTRCTAGLVPAAGTPEEVPS